jgi:hypothetical protein
LIKSLEEKNKAHLDEIATKLKEAEESQGDSEISELLRSRAMYMCRIGDKVSSPNLANDESKADQVGERDHCSGCGVGEDGRGWSEDRSGNGKSQAWAL